MSRHRISAPSPEVDLVVDGEPAKLARDLGPTWPAGVTAADVARFGLPEVKAGPSGFALLVYRRPPREITPEEHDEIDRAWIDNTPSRPDTEAEAIERARLARAGQNLSDEQWLLFRDWTGHNPTGGGAA